MTSRRALGLVLATTLLTAGLASVPADAAAPAPAHCPGLRTIAVTAAEKQVQTCLDNMQTPGLIAAGRTDVNDWAGLNASDSKNPPGPVPGIQVDGYFHDDSTLNAEYGWFHDAGCPTTGTTSSSSPVLLVSASSSPTTTSSATTSSPTATPTPRPTRATAAPRSTTTASSARAPAEQSASGTSGSPS